MFWVHIPIIRSTGCWVAAYGFLHQVFLDGWWSWEPLRRLFVRCGCCRATHGNIRTARTTYTAALKTTTHPKKLGAENHMLQLNIKCSWWWVSVPKIYRAKNALIKLPCCIKLAFQVISWARCTVKQPTNLIFPWDAFKASCLPPACSVSSIFIYNSSYYKVMYASHMHLHYTHKFILRRDNSKIKNLLETKYFWKPVNHT